MFLIWVSCFCKVLLVVERMWFFFFKEMSILWILKDVWCSNCCWGKFVRLNVEGKLFFLFVVERLWVCFGVLLFEFVLSFVVVDVVFVLVWGFGIDFGLVVVVISLNSCFLGLKILVFIFLSKVKWWINFFGKVVMVLVKWVIVGKMLMGWLLMGLDKLVFCLFSVLFCGGLVCVWWMGCDWWCDEVFVMVGFVDFIMCNVLVVW